MARVPDDGTPVGSYSWGRNIDGNQSKRWQVIQRINDAPDLSVWATYRVVLEVDDEWRAIAIAAILSAE